MRDLGCEIDVRLARFQQIEIFREGLPAPGYAFGHHHLWNILDALHQLDRQMALRFANGGEADATIAHDHRGHAMVGRGGKAAFPGDLTVIMGVHIDKARGDDHAGGVDLFLGAALDCANRGDSIADDADIAGKGRGSGAIHDGAATDH